MASKKDKAQELIDWARARFARVKDFTLHEGEFFETLVEAQAALLELLPDDPPDPGTCPRCGDLHRCEQVESANFETSRIPVSGVCPDCGSAACPGNPDPDDIVPDPPQPERATLHPRNGPPVTVVAAISGGMFGSERIVKFIEAGPLAKRLRHVLDRWNTRLDSFTVLNELARELEATDE